MMSVAAGIASTGKTVFASSFAMFAAGRAFEQVRNSIGYPHLNVKIGATHAGISVGEDGATHQCLEDIALMRSIPGMTVLNPADATEARAVVKAALDHKGPVYMRFGRLAVETIFDKDTFSFEIGQRPAACRWNGCDHRFDRSLHVYGNCGQSNCSKMNAFRHAWSTWRPLSRSTAKSSSIRQRKRVVC